MKRFGFLYFDFNVDSFQSIILYKMHVTTFTSSLEFLCSLVSQVAVNSVLLDIQLPHPV